MTPRAGILTSRPRTPPLQVCASLAEAGGAVGVEPVNSAKRIPQDHLLRKINKVLDLGSCAEKWRVSTGAMAMCRWTR